MELADLLDPASTAVVTMELQRGVVGDLAGIPSIAAVSSERSLLPACRRLLDAARGAGVPVIHALAVWRSDRSGTKFNAPILRMLESSESQVLEGTPAVDLATELGDCSEDRRSIRHHGLTPFTGTDLHDQLTDVGARTVVACGVSLNVGVTGLCLSAVDLGYEVVVPVDAVVGVPDDYGVDVIRHTLAAVATLSDVPQICDIWGAV
ncbi:MAG: isochorismatase family protein [Actinomycetota bacterium]